MEPSDVEHDPYIGKWVYPADSSPLEMVGRKGNHDIEWLAMYIVRILDIQPGDEVLDLCCGNGLITKIVSEHCKTIVGADYSPTLLKQANEISSGDNITYMEADARQMSDALGSQQFDKVYISAAFQYFNQDFGNDVIRGLRKHLKDDGSAAVLDIPDQSQKLAHKLRSVRRLLLPNSAEKDQGGNARFKSFGARMSYLARNALMQIKPKGDGATDELGWWWDRAEFAAGAKSAGFSCAILDQPEQNPHHTYRFDALLKTQ